MQGQYRLLCVQAVQSAVEHIRPGKAVNREDKRSRRYRDRHFAKFEESRRYRDRYRC